MDASTLCSLATVSTGGRAHINHMYFAWNDRFEIFWISDPDSRHSRNLQSDASAAITVYDSHQTWGRPDRGIQLFGSAAELRGGAAKAEARRVYSRRFDSYDDSSDDALRFYRFRPRTLKLFYERLLGAGTLVTASVTSAALTWKTTEVFV